MLLSITPIGFAAERDDSDRPQPNAQHPPYAKELFTIPRAGHGGFQRFLFWEVDPDRMQDRYAERETERADELRSRGIAPTFSLMHWRSAYAAAAPGSGHPDAESPAHRAWFEWMHDREDYFWLDRSGRHPVSDKHEPDSNLATPQAWIAPQRPLDPDDPDRDAAAGITNWGEWFNDGLADYAARVGIDGVSLADHFDQLPYHDVTQIDFQPAIIADFSRKTGVRVPRGSVDRRAAFIVERHFARWIDYWNQSYADWYGDMARRLKAATGRPAVIKMQKHTHIHDKRYHAIDARMIVEALPDDAMLAYQVEAWSIPWNRNVGGDTLAAYIGMVGTHLAREPAMTRGIMMPMAQNATPPASGEVHPMSIWRTTREYAKARRVELSDSELERLGQNVLETAWIALPWVHIATRDGKVERAAEYVQRQFSGHHPQELWETLGLTIYPTAPFGPALYYSASLEDAHERALQEYFPVRSLVEHAGGHAIPAYFVSDVALDALKPEAAPSAWLVDGLADLPADERRRLNRLAPVFDVSDIASAELPLRFSANGSGFGFIDQRGRTIIVVTRDQLGTDDTVTITLRLPTDGRYVLNSLGQTDEQFVFEIKDGIGAVKLPLSEWQSRVFSLESQSHKLD
ncbi:MAG: hypothetical protein AAF561_12000 [Planctomycetota bacterium]